MARKKRAGEDDHEAELGHDRPWVYFMIDCFFLVTQFFVITFKIKADEVILPQRLPPGGTIPSTSPVTAKEQINIHIMHGAAGAAYVVMNQSNNLTQINEALHAAAERGPDKYTVRLSYDRDVPFGDVMAIFNTCNKEKIAECGLIPLRTGERTN